MSKRMFELVEGSSRKFWEVWQDGSTVGTRYGKIGTAGQTTLKDEGSPDQARKLYDKLIAEKTRKGYSEAAAAEPPAAVPAEAAVPAPEAAPPATPAAATTPVVAAAAPPTPAPTPAAPAQEKPAKKAAKAPGLKAPKKSSPEYQALARGWQEVISTLHAEELSASEVVAQVDHLLADPAGAAVAEAETVLATLGAHRLGHDIQTEESLRKLYQGDPEPMLAEAFERNKKKIARQRDRVEVKHSTLVRLLEAGCDPRKSAKGEANTPLEAFVDSLPRLADEAKVPFAWSSPDGTSAVRVLEAFAARGESGTSGTALHEAAWDRWPVFDWLLERHPDGKALLQAWTRLVNDSLGPQVDPGQQAEREAHIRALAAQLRERGADGLCFEDGPGALAVAITRGLTLGVSALREAGADIDAPAPTRLVCVVTVMTNLLPKGRQGNPQWQDLAFPAGVAGRDVAESTVDAYDGWEAIIGDREGTAWGTFGHGRRADHARVRALAETLAAQGCAVSGLRKARAQVKGEQIPAGFKAAVDAALAGVVGRLGGDGAAAAARLAGLDPGVFGAHAYLKSASEAMWPLLPKEQGAAISVAWLKELLGVGDSMVGPDLSDLRDYPEGARDALKNGQWLGTRGSDVAVLEKSGRVVEATVRRGVVELAPDLATFVTRDLGQIAAKG